MKMTMSERALEMKHRANGTNEETLTESAISVISIYEWCVIARVL